MYTQVLEYGDRHTPCTKDCFLLDCLGIPWMLNHFSTKQLEASNGLVLISSTRISVIRTLAEVLYPLETHLEEHFSFSYTLEFLVFFLHEIQLINGII